MNDDGHGKEPTLRIVIYELELAPFSGMQSIPQNGLSGPRNQCRNEKSQGRNLWHIGLSIWSITSTSVFKISVGIPKYIFRHFLAPRTN